jgi:hypothetical protein
VQWRPSRKGQPPPTTALEIADRPFQFPPERILELHMQPRGREDRPAPDR